MVAEFDNFGCYSYRKIGGVTIPILLSMLMEHVIGLTDTAFLGRVSEVALGAAALGTVYFLAFFVLGTGFCFGAQILIARRNGEKDFRMTGKICYASGFFLIFLSLIVMAVMKYLTPELLPYMIKSEEICQATIEYLNWRTYGLFFVFMAGILRAFYVGIAQTRILTYSSIIMVLTNIILNYGLIFGKYGLPEMGIGGAAFASSIAEAIAFLCYIIYTLKFVDLKKYGFDNLSTFFRFDILKNVFTISFWMMLQPFMSVGVWFFFFIAVERLGERPLAVINIIRSCSALPFIIIHAFATATTSLVSNLIGENKTDQVWRLLKKILISASLFVVPILLFYAAFPKLCLRVYTDNAGLIEASVNAMYIMCISTFIQISAFIFFNAVSGTGAVKATVMIECVNLSFYAFFVYFVIIRTTPSPAVAWSAEIFYQTITAAFSLLFLWFGKWRNTRI